MMKETNPYNRANVVFRELGYDRNGLNEYELPRLVALSHTASQPRFYLTFVRQNGLTCAKSLDELAKARFSARRLTSALCLWTTPDPLAPKFANTNPYVYCAGNPIKFIDPSGEACIYYQGEYLGCDGIDDEKVLIIPDVKGTIYEDDPHKTVNNVGYTQEFTEALIKFVKVNNGNKEAFLSDEDIYNCLIELPGNASAMKAASVEMPPKNKLEDDQFREHGGYLENGAFIRVNPGPIASENSLAAQIFITDKDVTTIHNHPEGIFPNQKGFIQYPSSRDIATAGSQIHYTIANRQTAVYVYNKRGIIAKIDYGPFMSFFFDYGMD